METLVDLIELAHLSARNARVTNSREVARTLWKMATEYAERASKLDHGKMPDIGEPPALLR